MISLQMGDLSAGVAIVHSAGDPEPAAQVCYAVLHVQLRQGQSAGLASWGMVLQPVLCFQSVQA